MHIKHTITVILAILVLVASVSRPQAKSLKTKSANRLNNRLNRPNAGNAVKAEARRITKQNLKRKGEESNIRKRVSNTIKNVIKKADDKKGNKRQGKQKRVLTNTKLTKSIKGAKSAPTFRKSMSPRASNSTCNGVSVESSCMTSLKASMKFDRDKITNFKNQLERAEFFDKIIGNKMKKNSDFSNSTTYLLIALGSDPTNLNCSGNPATTVEAVATYNTLANCSTAVEAACFVPASASPNFTQLTACKETYEKVEKRTVCA